MSDESTPRFCDPALCFGAWNASRFGSPIRHYAEILTSRVMPLFDDLDGEQQRAGDQVLNASGWGPDDYGAAMEAAYEHSIDHTLQFIELRTVFLATGVAGLFHLFEKQLYRFLNHELRRNLSKKIDRWEEATDAIDALDQPIGPDGQTALRVAFNNEDIKELRLVANVVKHGQGRSYDELKGMGAHVVEPGRLERDFTVGAHSVFGVALAIDRDDIERYVAALLSFWTLEGTFWRRLPDEPGNCG
jgi:hypothetical protein